MDAGAVHEGAVQAVQVFDRHRAAVHRDDRVLPGGPHLVRRFLAAEVNIDGFVHESTDVVLPFQQPKWRGIGAFATDHPQLRIGRRDGGPWRGGSLWARQRLRPEPRTGPTWTRDRLRAARFDHRLRTTRRRRFRVGVGNRFRQDRIAPRAEPIRNRGFVLQPRSGWHCLSEQTARRGGEVFDLDLFRVRLRDWRTERGPARFTRSLAERIFGSAGVANDHGIASGEGDRVWAARRSAGCDTSIASGTRLGRSLEGGEVVGG